MLLNIELAERVYGARSVQDRIKLSVAGNDEFSTLEQSISYGAGIQN